MKYLYNGTPMHPLPEWDKQKYPYAIMNYGELAIDGGFWVASLIVSSNPFVFYDEFVEEDGILSDEYAITGEWLRYFMTDNPAVAALYFGLQVGDFEPEEWGVHASGHADKAESIGLEYDWSNHDILNRTAGTVKLAASYPINAETGEEIRDYEPVPVSPVMARNPAAMLAGFQLGAAIRRMRGQP